MANVLILDKKNVANLSLGHIMYYWKKSPDANRDATFVSKTNQFNIPQQPSLKN